MLQANSNSLKVPSPKRRSLRSKNSISTMTSMRNNDVMFYGLKWSGDSTYDIYLKKTLGQILPSTLEMLIAKKTNDPIGELSKLLRRAAEDEVYRVQMIQFMSTAQKLDLKHWCDRTGRSDRLKHYKQEIRDYEAEYARLLKLEMRDLKWEKNECRRIIERLDEDWDIPTIRYHTSRMGLHQIKFTGIDDEISLFTHMAERLSLAQQSDLSSDSDLIEEKEFLEYKLKRALMIKKEMNLDNRLKLVIQARKAEILRIAERDKQARTGIDKDLFKKFVTRLMNAHRASAQGENFMGKKEEKARFSTKKESHLEFGEQKTPSILSIPDSLRSSKFEFDALPEETASETAMRKEELRLAKIQATRELERAIRRNDYMLTEDGCKVWATNDFSHIGVKPNFRKRLALSCHQSVQEPDTWREKEFNHRVFYEPDLYIRRDPDNFEGIPTNLKPMTVDDHLAVCALRPDPLPLVITRDPGPPKTLPPISKKKKVHRMSSLQYRIFHQRSNKTSKSKTNLAVIKDVSASTSMASGVTVGDKESEPDADRELVPQAYREPVTQAYREPVPQADREPVQQADREPVPQTDREPVPQADKEPVPQAGRKLVPQADKELVPQADREPIPQADKEPVPQADKEPVQQADREPVPQADKELVPQADREPVPQADKEPVPQADKDNQPDKYANKYDGNDNN